MAADDKGPSIVGVTAMFEVIACIAVSLRFWSQRVKRRKFALHDALIIAALISVTGLAVCLILSVVLGGLGKHAIELAATPEKIVIFEKLIIGLQVCWEVGITCTRLSILALYIDLFSEAHTFRKVCYVVMAISCLWGIIMILIAFFICRPLAYNWDLTIPNGKCGNTTAAYIAAHASNFCIDLTIALLPVRVLWSLKMPTHRKLGIMVMFAMGALICAISISRIALYQYIVDYGQLDFTYTSTTLYLFTAVEPAMGITLACLPLMRPLFENVSPVSTLSYIKSLLRSSGSRTTKDHSVGRHGFAETDSVEGLRVEAHATGGKEGSLHYQGLTGSKGIYVKRGFERNTYDSYEMHGP